MQRLEKTFAHARERGELVLVAYLTAGYPHLSDTAALIEAAYLGGADIIELGVPFSDPLGDGPLIQATTNIALHNGVTTSTVLDYLAGTRERGVNIPIMLMGYCNPFLRYGVEQLYADAAAAGADGFIIPDLPAHEADLWLTAAETYDLGQVFFAAPGSAPERLRASVVRSRGFLYALAANGVTGIRDELDPGLNAYLGRVRETAGELPVCVGFGISSPKHVAALRGRADGVIVGSALLRTIGAVDEHSGRAKACFEMIRDLKKACR